MVTRLPLVVKEEIMRKSLSEDRILEQTLELMDEKGGASGTNFREIARRLGCAHTSLYNFYGSFSELQMAALNEIRKRMGAYAASHMEKQNQPYGFLGYVGAVIDFNLEHMGWYRFLWMDSHPWEMEAVVSKSERPDRMFAKELMTLSGGTLDETGALRLHGVLHGYYHGELMKYINSRSAIESKEDLKETIMENLKSVCDVLMQAWGTKDEKHA